MKTKIILVLAFYLVLSGCSELLADSNGEVKLPNRPVGAAVSHEYPNLFVQVTQRSPEQVRAKITAAYQQLFFGDPKTQAVYYPDGSNAYGEKAYIWDVNSNDVRSEGMSYGMMIAVQMNDKAVFDALWNWSLSHMYNDADEHPAKGFFAWSVSTQGEKLDEMPAPDGEEYFATALYFASKRWGDGKGIYAYSLWGDKILRDILHRESITGPTNRGEMTAINLFDKEHKMVRFTPDVVNSERTDASYHLPAFYQIWAKVGPEKDRDFWQQATQVSRDYFNQASHPDTGLTPDYGNFDATPWAASWRPESVDYRYDAWRTAMNWSVDWSWWKADQRQVELSNRLQAFFESQGMDEYKSLYTLDGKPLGGGQTTGIVAMNATASLAADHPRRQKFLAALWERPIPTGPYRYYDGMLYMMALLHCSGEFKAWY
ncbi:glycosyl hydrolase family 8 [Glaciecola sp. 1036]|uniref:glycosyl hydrolase family 8 n=1 Tax=Alteromonadaceae TaxID=72275 RepID=UPI003CFDCFF3